MHAVNDLIWCSSCGTEVSLARAVADLPCPGCGGVNYFVLATDKEHDALLSLAERMQRIGCWEVAEAAFRRCLEAGYISAADCNLSLHALAWRKDCASVARRLILHSDSAVTIDALRAALLKDYDEYTVDWLLSEFTGLRRVPFGSTFIVEVPHAAQET